MSDNEEEFTPASQRAINRGHSHHPVTRGTVTFAAGPGHCGGLATINPYKELKERLLQSYAESYQSFVQETGTGEEQDVCIPLSAAAAKGVATLLIY
jgi:hypothetical protein